LDTKDYLALYSTKCLQCSHLVENGKKAYAKCHFTKGNKHCPASEVRLVVVGKAVAYATKVLKARDAHDLKTEARLLQYVSTQSEAFKTRFYSALDSGNP